MKKKIKIKINGKINKIDNKTKLSDLVKNLKVTLKKVAIESVSYTHLRAHETS